jgi:hypothetical protein
MSRRTYASGKERERGNQVLVQHGVKLQVNSRHAQVHQQQERSGSEGSMRVIPYQKTQGITVLNSSAAKLG